MKKILLKKGIVIDPSQKMKEQRDVLIEDGIIVKLEANLSGDKETQVIDVAGSYVVPGLIDMHCHIYPNFSVEPDGLPTIHPEAHMFQSGVTTAVDAGTCGARDFISFKEKVIDQSRLRILAFINIANGGMVNLESEQDISQFTPQTVAAMAREFDSAVVGIKTAHYWVGKSFDDKHPAWEAVDRTLEAGILCDKMAMFDFQPNLPGRTYEELIGERMRPGDIHTHVYAQQFPILDGEGKVNRFLFEARERGIIFDLGHGAGSFWFRNAVPAYEQGFYPDVISTDLYLDNVAGPVINLIHVMSKYLCIGMPLEEIIYRVTRRPAELLRHEELGTLSIGSPADVAILKVECGNYGYADSGKGRLKGGKRLECLMTMRAGEIVYDPMALSMPRWEEAPESYWISPGIIQYREK